jgi:hypothetical protein
VIQIEIAGGDTLSRAAGMAVWCRRNDEVGAFEVGVCFERVAAAYQCRQLSIIYMNLLK